MAVRTWPRPGGGSNGVRRRKGSSGAERIDLHAAAYARFLRDLRDEKLDLAQPYRQQMVKA